MKRVVFDTGGACIAVGLLERKKELALAMRWNDGLDVSKKTGEFAYRAESPHGKSTDWVILPWDFAVVVGRALIEKKALGMDGFDPTGYRLLTTWLLQEEAVFDGFSF